MAPLPDSGDPVLRAIIEKMLAPQIEHRYRSARAVCEDLMNFLDGFPTSAARQKAEAGRVTIPLPETGRQPDRPTEPMEVPLFQSRSTPRTVDIGGVARAAAVLLCAVVVLSEGAASVRAERLRQRIETLEPADVAAVRQDLVSIHRWAPVGMAARAIVDQPLKTRMVQLADRTILDYRHDAPVVTEAQWRQAWACLTLAADVAPDDRAVDAKRHVVQGHLKRLSARVPAEFQDAIRDFREAALLDPTVPDPYLGLARVHADNVRDVDALADDIRKAVALGYQSSRRERAELGGAYKTRADDR
jgi:hypothetical protein